MTYFVVWKFYLFKSGYFCHYDFWCVTALEDLSKGIEWTCGDSGIQPDSFLGINKIYLIDHRIHNYSFYILETLTLPFSGTSWESVLLGRFYLMSKVSHLTQAFLGNAMWHRTLSDIFNAWFAFCYLFALSKVFSLFIETFLFLFTIQQMERRQ